MAFKSLEVIATVCVFVLTKFQFASTAFTVIFNEVPAVCVVGVPVFPVVVPGAAVSPGINTCNLVAVPAFTSVAAPVLAVNGVPF